jgi:hypothetical protein
MQLIRPIPGEAARSQDLQVGLDLPDRITDGRGKRQAGHQSQPIAGGLVPLNSRADLLFDQL